jgi:hypothetical protein
MEIIQHKFKVSYFEISSLQLSNRFAHPLTCTNHTVPYGTAVLDGAVLGTSCQATIAPSLRDISQWARGENLST